MTSRSSNFSPDELETLVRCMESNPQLAHGQFGGEFATKKSLRDAWEAVAAEVNCNSLDVHRTTHQLRNKWLDYKCRVRQKAAKVSIRNGELSDQQKLTPLELRVLTLIGPGRVKAVTDNGFDIGVVKQIVPREIARETSTTQVPVSCAADKSEENDVLYNELNCNESRLLTEENGQTGILASSQIKKENDSELPESSNESLYKPTVLQENENHKTNDVQYTVLIPIQFPFSDQENGQNKNLCIQTTSIPQSVLPHKESGGCERFVFKNGTVIPVQSSLSEQENENGGVLIQNGTVIPVQSSLSQQENEETEKNNAQNSPVIHVLSRFPEQQNVSKEQNVNQSIPVLSNESSSLEGINEKGSETTLKITSVISTSSQQEKGKNEQSASKRARLDVSNSSQQENVSSNDTAQNWELAGSSSKDSSTTRCQRLRIRRRNLRDELENAVDRQIIDTQAEMANELKNISSHLATIANTNIEILKYLKNVEKKQETVISYLSVALNLDDV